MKATIWLDNSASPLKLTITKRRCFRGLGSRSKGSNLAIQLEKMEGWIKLYRKINDKPFARKPAYLAVWVYLLTNANYEDKEIMTRDGVIVVKRGQLFTSQRKIADYFGLTVSVLNYIFFCLKVEHMIEQSSTKKWTIVTILNYEKYQGVEHTVEQSSNRVRTEFETTKNIRNKELIQKKKIIKKESANETATTFLQTFNKIFNTNYRAVEPILNNFTYWNQFYTIEQMAQAVTNAKADKFWKDKLTPQTLLRRRNPQGDEVDYIGSLMNRKRESNVSDFIKSLPEMS